MRTLQIFPLNQLKSDDIIRIIRKNINLNLEDLISKFWIENSSNNFIVLYIQTESEQLINLIISLFKDKNIFNNNLSFKLINLKEEEFGFSPEKIDLIEKNIENIEIKSKNHHSHKKKHKSHSKKHRKHKYSSSTSSSDSSSSSESNKHRHRHSRSKK